LVGLRDMKTSSAKYHSFRYEPFFLHPLCLLRALRL